MFNKIVSLIMLSFLMTGIIYSKVPEKQPPDWWADHRFGLFIHWGLYAIPAWHEQYQYRHRIPRSEYEKLMHEFNPVHFDPHAWLDLMEKVGMKYICFTTKHIDGFCMWDTRQTDYNIMNTPYGKDILKMLADACHERNVPLCLYYSVVDNHHPNYPNQGRAHELPGPVEGDEPDLDKYLQFLKAQVRELCTQYGKIHCFWWDANRTGIEDPSINNMIRELQPGIVINNRGFDAGDFGTPERDYQADDVNAVLRFDEPTEACQAVGRESWGYKKDEDYYTPRYLMQSISNVMAKGGNYLLNVGPKADGTIDKTSVDILETIGQWYQNVKQAFIRAEPASQMIMNRNILLTREDNSLYVILHKPPMLNRVLLEPLHSLPGKAILLNTDEPVEPNIDFLPRYHRREGRKEFLRLRKIPVDQLCNEVPVIKLTFNDLD